MHFEDDACVKRCLNGHPDDFRKLVERYQGPLLAFLCGRLGGREPAEEAAQESFVRAFCRLSQLRDHGRFFPWLLGIAHRVALEQRRLGCRTCEADPAAIESGADPSPAGDLDLREAVAALPDPFREAILLRFYGGLSCLEVAERSGVALGTLTKRLSKAYAMLRKALGMERKP